MSLNYKEIQLILDELALEGCMVQEIVQPDFKTLVLDLYRPGGAFSVLISMRPEASRLHRTANRPKKPKKTQRFAALLRSRLKGGRIAAAATVGADRLVHLIVHRSGERCDLYVKLWGAASNVLLTDPDGTIVDSLYRRPKRSEVSGGLFRPQPPADPGNFQIREHPADLLFNEFIDSTYAEVEASDRVTRARRELMAAYRKRRTNLHAALRAAERRRSEYEDYAAWKERADVLLAGRADVPPKAARVRLPGLMEPDGLLEIELDPSLSVTANAERLYDRYKKARAGLEQVNEEIDALNKTIQDLEIRTGRLSASTDPAEIEASLETIKPADKAEDKGRPGLCFESGGFTILVGRTAAENDGLLRHHVNGNDWWLHTRDHPGGYVFVKSKRGKSIPLDTLLDAGTLAVHYSKARRGGRADLYYTQVKHLRRAKDAKRGTVLPTQERNLSVRLDPNRLRRLKGD